MFALYLTIYVQLTNYWKNKLQNGYILAYVDSPGIIWGINWSKLQMLKHVDIKQWGGQDKNITIFLLKKHFSYTLSGFKVKCINREMDRYQSVFLQDRFILTTCRSQIKILSSIITAHKLIRVSAASRTSGYMII